MKTNTFIFYIITGILLISNPGFCWSQIKINEFVASNVTQLADEDGEFPDWVEFFNSSDQAVNLSQYTFTDDITDTLKWSFPSIQLEPGEFKVVFASGKNRTDLVNSWHSVVDMGSTLKYIVPDSEMGDTWKNTGFDDQNWLEGPSGIGYGDNDDATETGSVMSVYARKEFTISDIDDVIQLVFHIDYDDGFVAYINGVEIARDRLGDPGDVVAYNAPADDYNHEAQIYQGLPPNEFKVYGWESYLKQGTNVLAVEVHNHSSTSSDLSCIPFLTLGLKSQGTYPVSEHVEVPDSYLHTNFKISAGGESLYLFNNKQFVDSVAATRLLSDISYGRQPDGGANWYYYETPTPSLTNGNEGVATLTTDSVIFSSIGGNYANSFMLQLSVQNNASGKIYYTTDGSVPTVNSTLYEQEIEVNADMVVRARAIVPGQLSGPVITQTYVLGLDHDFPIVCLSTNPENFFDYYTGIYELGPNASSSNPHYGANFWEDWEKPVHFEYYDKNGTKQIDQGAGVKIYGAWSRANPQKSLALFARKEYGDGAFNYKFFDCKENEKFEAIVLRNAGNGFYYTHFRDGMMTTAMRDIGLEYQGFQPTAVYINGEYWGILNMREKINEHFISDNTHINSDDINILESTYETDGEVVNGENSKYVKMLDFIKANSLQSDVNYNYVCEVIDIDNFIDYYLVQTYVDNTDWPGNNNKFWNTTNDASKYRWVLFDTDFGFGLYGSQNYSNNTIAYASSSTQTGLHNETWATLLFRKLLGNAKFKERFAQRGCDYLNTYWQSDLIDPIIDEFKALFKDEMVAHCQRWELDYNNWLSQVNRLKTFSQNRPFYYNNYLRSAMGYDGSNAVYLDVFPDDAGSIKLNSIVPDSYPFTGTYFNRIPIEITAIPKPGYRFVRWEGAISSTNRHVAYNINQNSTHTAVFEKVTEESKDIVINEIFYKSSEDIKPGDWVELYNYGESTVDLEGWIFRDSNRDSAFVMPSYFLAPDNYLVLCKSLKKFKTTYPDIQNVIGEFSFGLSSMGDNLRLFNSNSAIIDAVDYYTSGSWPVEANGQGASCELSDQYEANEKGSNWYTFGTGGTPGAQNAWFIPNPVSQIKQGLKSGLICYPNPVNDYTNISFHVKNAGLYRLDLVSLSGSLIKNIAHNYYVNGDYSFKLSKEDMPAIDSGFYLIRLTGTKGTETIKVIIK